MCQFKDGSAQLIIEGKGGLKKNIISQPMTI